MKKVQPAIFGHVGNDTGDGIRCPVRLLQGEIGKGAHKFRFRIACVMFQHFAGRGQAVWPVFQFLPDPRLLQQGCHAVVIVILHRQILRRAAIFWPNIAVHV